MSHLLHQEMDALSLEPSAIALLQQGYRNNWERYSATLNGQDDGAPAWDLCVLTASNARQAAAYEIQIDARRQAGLLPPRTVFRVIADPESGPGAMRNPGAMRIGSGGATLRVLSLLAQEDPLALSGRRILILHSGGDSRRLPHCSATGKLFARVPHELPDGRPSSLYDEFLVSLSGLPALAPEGVLVASGDVLLLFDHLQLELSRPGVTGVAAAMPAEDGSHHGVYLTRPGSRRVASFLHKPSVARLRQAGAIDPFGRVQIDTGLVWIDRSTAARLLALAGAIGQAADGVTINLYGDLLAPLAESTVRDEYLRDASDGPATPALQAVRATIWEALRGVPFAVEGLQPAIFIHFGATREYLQALHTGMRWFAASGWRQQASSWMPPSPQADPADHLVAVNAYLRDRDLPPNGCFLDTRLEAHLAASGVALLSHVQASRERLDLLPDTALEQLPIEQDAGFVTRLYGLADDAKRSLVEGGLFLNRPWSEWLSRATARGISAGDLWPDEPDPAQRTLWDAQLYPLCADREESLDAVLWLQWPERATEDDIARWRAAPRLSLAESYLRADVRRLVREEIEIEDLVRARRYLDGLQAERPATELAPLLGREHRHRAAQVADWLAESSDPWLPLRGYQALFVATAQRRYEERAFSSLARLVRAHTPFSALAQGNRNALRHCTVRLPARIDFGGGWTDTPPYSLERGGAVLNAAVALDGALPIVAQAEWLDEPIIELVSRDIESVWRPRLAGDVLDYANPADPFALLKAALVFRGIVPAQVGRDNGGQRPQQVEIAELLRPLGGGLRLTTATHIPRGSGLGTSSILAGAVLQCLSRLLGIEMPPEQLYDEVLCLEQMITTGGGWQDQVGGLAPGIKLITSQPGLPQRLQVAPLPMTPALRRALDERLLLLYTGQRRLAKDILRSVMGRWMARDPEMVRHMEGIARLALAMREALLAVDLDALGGLLSEHWRVLKAMDPGCTNPFIDDLLACAAPYVCGGKLAGAGGGGYAILIARDADASAALARALASRYAAGAPATEGGVSLWPCQVVYA